MPRFSAADRQTTAKTSARGPTLVAGANDSLIIREVGVFSTVATSSRVALRTITAARTAGTALDEVHHRLGQTGNANGSATQAPTTDHTFVAGFIRNVELPAAIGGGYIWVFGNEGLIIPEGTGNGICLTLPGGTDQIIDFYFDWDE